MREHLTTTRSSANCIADAGSRLSACASPIPWRGPAGNTSANCSCEITEVLVMRSGILNRESGSAAGGRCSCLVAVIRRDLPLLADRSQGWPQGAPGWPTLRRKEDPDPQMALFAQARAAPQASLFGLGRGAHG